MQLGCSRFALTMTSCSQVPPAIPIWTVAVPKVGAVPPPITSNRKSSSFLSFRDWTACRASYNGRPIIVQVAPVSKSAKVDNGLMVMGMVMAVFLFRGHRSLLRDTLLIQRLNITLWCQDSGLGKSRLILHRGYSLLPSFFFLN